MSTPSSGGSPYREPSEGAPLTRAVLHDSPSFLWAYVVLLALSVGPLAFLASEPRWFDSMFGLLLCAALPLFGPELALQSLRAFHRIRVRVESVPGSIVLRSLRARHIRIEDLEGHQCLVTSAGAMLLLTPRGGGTIILELRKDEIPGTLLSLLGVNASREGELRFHIRPYRGDFWGLRAIPLMLLATTRALGGPYGSLPSELLYFFVALPLIGLAWLVALGLGLSTMAPRRLVLGPDGIRLSGRAPIAYAAIQEVNDGATEILVRFHASPSSSGEETFRFMPGTPGLARLQTLAVTLRIASSAAKLRA